MAARAIPFALAALCCAAGAQAQTADRVLISLAAGEETALYGTTYRAAAPTRALVVQSSELITAAVLEGELMEGAVAASAGEALVTPIDGSRTRRYGFDAARLAASLPPQWAGEAETALAAIAQRQRRRAFWGLIEPVGVNAAAPVAPEVEAFRRAYLGNPTVLALRREAEGDRAVLAGLTVQRFAGAVAARNVNVIADLIDPVPFSEANPDPAIWLPARTAFAARLAEDDALAAALVALPAASGGEDNFDIGGAFRVALVMRDRAMFVAAVEPVQ